MVWSVWRTSQCCQPKPKPWLNVFVHAMTCPFSFLFFLFFFFFPFLSLCVCLCLPLRLTDANTPKKCRALFGLDQLSLWCKPCRYNSCCTSDRKTSTVNGVFFLIIGSDFSLKTRFCLCGIRWLIPPLLLLAEEFLLNCCTIFLHEAFVQPSGRKWISKMRLLNLS